MTEHMDEYRLDMLKEEIARLKAEVERLRKSVVSWSLRLDAGGADESVFDEIFDEHKRIEDNA